MGLEAKKTELAKARLSDRDFWELAKNLHRESHNQYANGLHIYFELQRVRDAALKL